MVVFNPYMKNLNVIVGLKFELAYNYVAVQHVSYYAKETSSSIKWNRKKKKEKDRRKVNKGRQKEKETDR